VKLVGVAISGVSAYFLVHSRSLFHGHDDFWCRWTVAQGALGPNYVIVLPQSFDQKGERNKSLAVFTS
jgi:hypothetical protein